MAIYQIIKGDITCDECKKFIANVVFDKNDSTNLERIKVRCVDCGAKQLINQSIFQEAIDKFRQPDRTVPPKN